MKKCVFVITSTLGKQCLTVTMSSMRNNKEWPKVEAGAI